MDTPARRALLAHHEAGHAIIGAKLGIEIFYATIKPDERRGGHVRRGPVTYEDGCIIALAGPLSELRFGGYDYFDQWCEKYRAFRQQDLTRALEAVEDEFTWKFSCQFTARLVNHYWDEIEQLAKLLLEHETITFSGGCPHVLQ